MRDSELTPRQQEVKKLLEAGLTPRQVADALGVWPQAVYAIRRRITEGKGAPRWARGPRDRKTGKGAA